MKAFFIDSLNHTITETTIASWKEIAPKIGCKMFTCVGVEDDDTLYVDDEGLLTQPEAFFLYKGYVQPLAGNAVVLGTDEQGLSVDPKMTLDDLKKRVTFLTPMQAYIWAQQHDC